MEIFSIWFHTPSWLIIWACFWVWSMIFLFRKKGRENFAAMKELKKVYKNNTFLYRVFQLSIISISLLFWIALAWVYSSYSIQKESKNGIDIEIVFDVSYSMVASDLLPSRIEVAKKGITEFVWNLKADRVGLILFSGKPFQSIPLTYDYIFIQDFIDSMWIESVNQNNPILQGTAMGDGLVLATDILTRDTLEREKVIILLTDGEANKWVDPTLALKFLKEKNIKVYAIGVGKEDQTYIETPLVWGFTQKVLIEWIDEPMLQRISKETWGKYFRADSPETFKSILDEIWKLEKKQLEYETINLQTSYTWIILILLLSNFWIFTYIIWYKKIRL